MKSKYFFFMLLFFLLGQLSYSQQWQWANHIGSSNYDGGTSGACDNKGNFYITGDFQGNTCQFVTQTLTRHGNNSIFLAKYDKNGSEIWVQQFDVNSFPSDEYDGIADLIVDDLGFVYITGIFYATAQFGSFTLSADGGDMFLAKFTPEGGCLWAKKVGSTLDDGGSGIAVDSLRNVYVCGQTSYQAFFDTISVPPGEFLAKYDSNGNCIWAKQKFSIVNQYFQTQVGFTGMKIYKDNLYACGYEMSTSFTIDSILINHPGKYGNILCCFDLNGNIKWLKEGISTVAYSGYNPTIDASGDIFVTGYFYDTINFSGTKLFGKQFLSDDFICKYDRKGDLLWARQCHATSDAVGKSVSSDELGNCYLTGRFSGQAEFGSDTLTSDTDQDMFLARYNTDGDCMGMIHFGKAEGNSVGQDQDGNPYIVGQFLGNITIGQTTLNNYGYREDIFVAKCGKITGLEEKKNSLSNQLLIYANPNEGMCSITLPDEFRHEQHLTLSIYNNQGKLIQQSPVEIIDEKVSLNISAEAKGFYTAILTNGKKSYSGKIIFK